MAVALVFKREDHALIASTADKQLLLGSDELLSLKFYRQTEDYCLAVYQQSESSDLRDLTFLAEEVLAQDDEPVQVTIKKVAIDWYRLTKDNWPLYEANMPKKGDHEERAVFLEVIRFVTPDEDVFIRIGDYKRLGENAFHCIVEGALPLNTKERHDLFITASCVKGSKVRINDYLVGDRHVVFAPMS